ncbi:MAG: class I SAM-dependent methyltransferase [Planctomycetota bacterium]|nr:class I SAM-dependent methyltransferase [Planctomycetota bacterium]
MRQLLPSVVSPSVPCKCCHGEARIFGVVDFNQTCAQRTPRALDACGVPVYYHRCLSCGFLFTTAFDNFATEDFAKFIYNEDYKLVDPEYAEARPRRIAFLVSKMFELSRHLRVLDYGGGNGAAARFLRDYGFTNISIYDPFVPEFSVRPQGQFDLILSFEVVEHSPHPCKIFTEMDSLLAPTGMILFSTLLQPPEIDREGVNWWYVGPRNGHVSIYTNQALAKLSSQLKFKLKSFSEDLHLLFRKPFELRPLEAADPPAHVVGAD